MCVRLKRNGCTSLSGTPTSVRLGKRGLHIWQWVALLKDWRTNQCLSFNGKLIELPVAKTHCASVIAGKMNRVRYMQENVSGAFTVIDPRFSFPGSYFFILSKILMSVSILNVSLFFLYNTPQTFTASLQQVYSRWRLILVLSEGNTPKKLSHYRSS